MTSASRGGTLTSSGAPPKIRPIQAGGTTIPGDDVSDLRGTAGRTGDLTEPSRSISMVQGSPSPSNHGVRYRQGPGIAPLCRSSVDASLDQAGIGSRSSFYFQLLWAWRPEFPGSWATAFFFA
ncbi:hypothetical protein FSOLCH5_007103 [Fusarium solani]